MTMSDAPKKLGSLRPTGPLPRPPFFLIAIFLVLVIASWIPLVVFARARVMRSSEPRVHIFQDMDKQPKFGPQDSTPLFADGRAMRLPIAGTVARGQLEEDDHFYRGFSTRANADGRAEVVFFNSLPQEIQGKLMDPVTGPMLLRRGQERFNIYCATCHGLDGYGNGPINNRAVDRQESRWVPAANLHTVRERPDGHLYNTITNGIRTMGGYGPQITPHDRWAIVAYLRALQLSQQAPPSAVPASVVPAEAAAPATAPATAPAAQRAMAQ